MALVLSGAVALLDDDTMVHDGNLMGLLRFLNYLRGMRFQRLGCCRLLLSLICCCCSDNHRLTLLLMSSGSFGRLSRRL